MLLSAMKRASSIIVRSRPQNFLEALRCAESLILEATRRPASETRLLMEFSAEWETDRALRGRLAERVCFSVKGNATLVLGRSNSPNFFLRT